MKIKSLLFAALAAGMCFSANAFGENDYIGLAEGAATPEAITAAGEEGLELAVNLYDTDLYGYCRVLDGTIKLSDGLEFVAYKVGSREMPTRLGERIQATNAELSQFGMAYAMTTQFRTYEGETKRRVQYLGSIAEDEGVYGETGGALFYIKVQKLEGATKETITFPTPVIATRAKFNDAGEEDPNGNDSFKPAERVYEVDFTNSAVNDLGADKAVASVKYYNAAGVAADAAFDGVNIVVTKYVDGSQKVVKIVK